MYQKVWIAEKPSLGRAIAAELPKPHKNIDGGIEVNGGKEVVTWCIGHILRTANPEEYDEAKWKKWSLETLPIVPSHWVLKEKEETRKQLNIIKKLVANSKEIVNCGDPDREGQTLIDEVIDYFKANAKPTYRVLVNDLNPKAIRASIQNIEDNNKYKYLYHAGMARQRADWLVGMNGSRAATCSAQKQGFYGVIPYGRVQTPVLALIVNREDEIKNFKPVTFYPISGIFEQGKSFEGVWQYCSVETDEEGEEVFENNGTSPEWLDNRNRIIDKNKALEIQEKVKKAGKGVVSSYKKEQKPETRPKLFNMSGLQAAMGKFGFDLKKTIDVLQKLYESGYVTYPRSESTNLPHKQKEEIAKVIENAKSIPEFMGKEYDVNQKNRVWDDEASSPHHAIIPTSKTPLLGSFNEDQKTLYLTIMRQTLIHFMPDCLADMAKIEIDVAGEKFSITGKIIVQEGWKKLVRDTKEDKKELPFMKQGDEVIVKDVKLNESQTQPKKPFKETEMPVVMGEIHKLIDDPELKKRMKELSGLGTEATRGFIVSELIRREFVKTEKGYLVSTDLGRNYIEALPERLKDPVLTSEQEHNLKKVYTKKLSLEAFTKEMENYVDGLIDILSKADFTTLKGLGNTKRKPNGSGNAPQSTGRKCPKCGGELVVRTIKNGPKAGQTFIGCGNWAQMKCDYTEWENDKPKK